MTEFLNGHWEWIFNSMHMTRDCFCRFVSILEGTCRLHPSSSIFVSEKVMIFLYTTRHGASNHDSLKRDGNVQNLQLANTLVMC